MNSGLYSVLYLTYFIILDSVLYFADIECGFSHAKSYGLSNNVKFRQFLGFYSIFCLGRTKNEVHICNLHAKTQLLMYDKGGLSTKKFSTPEGRWRTVRKPGLDENSGFEWKNLYFQYQ